MNERITGTDQSDTSWTALASISPVFVGLVMDYHRCGYHGFTCTFSEKLWMTLCNRYIAKNAVPCLSDLACCEFHGVELVAGSNILFRGSKLYP
jgi:hypothetical protein